jgi:para-nitrobenzyl esterase
MSTLYDLGDAVAGSIGCEGASDRLACLRETPAGTLLQNPLAMAYGRVSYGNDVLPENPADVMRAAGALPVPVMMGVTRDDGRTFVSFDPEPITDARFAALLGKAFGDGAAAVEQAYPLSVYECPGLAWATAMTGRVWACPTLENLELLEGNVRLRLRVCRP